MEYEQIFLDSRKRFEYNTVVEFGLEERERVDSFSSPYIYHNNCTISIFIEEEDGEKITRARLLLQQKVIREEAESLFISFFKLFPLNRKQDLILGKKRRGGEDDEESSD